MSRSLRLLGFNAYDDTRRSTDNKPLNPYEDNKDFIVQMFGIDDEGKTTALFVEGFKPFFYIKVGDNWTEKDKKEFINHLSSKMGSYYEGSIALSKLIKRQNLYMFDAGKMHQFILIKFNNMPALNKAKKLWFTDINTPEEGFVRKLKEDGYLFNDTYTTIYEANIPPLLRLFHIKEVSPSGWISISLAKALKHKRRSTSCTYEYTIHYSNIRSEPYKETRVPYKICYFDIEASSSHGDFPLAIKNYKKLATDIVDLWMYGDKKFDKPLEKTEKLLRDIIFTAFREKLDEPDKSVMYLENHIHLVYPKTNRLSNDRLTNLFNNWIALKPALTKTGKTDEDDDDDEDNCSDDDAEEILDNDNGADNSENGENLCEEKTYYKRKKYIKKYKNTTGSIIDLLNDQDEKRNTKLAELTKTLGSIFPELEGDQVTFIGSVFRKYTHDDAYLNHCITLSSCNTPKNVNNCKIESYNTEQEVLLAWTDLIRREDPDIIVGYNVDCFDYDFMDKRAQELDCRKKFLMLSRNKNEACLNKDWRTGKENIEATSIVLASGQHDSRYIKMNGRLQIDLISYFRRNHQLASFKLDHVSSHFIGDDVNKIEHDEAANTTKIYSKNLTGLEESSFIKFEEISHSTQSYKQEKKFEIHDVDHKEGTFKISSLEYPNMEIKVRWCLAKDDVTPQEIFKLGNGSDDDKAIIAKYCLQDCRILDYLMDKNDTITEIIEMSRMCSVPMSYLLSRGQGIKLTSYMAKKCRQKKMLMPVLQKTMDDEGYEGAIVLDPKCGIYLEDPVACVDYSSLYPSSMISENLSHDSKVWTKEYDLDGNLLKDTGYKDDAGEYIYDNLPEYEYVDVTYDTYKWVRKTPKAAATKEKVGYKTCRFAQFKEGRAILPSILEELLAERKSTRKQIPLQTDEFMKNVLDKRQLSIKTTANSLYGQCGAKTSTLYEKDVAASCTAVGRKLLIYGKTVIEEAYKDRIIQLKSGEEVKVDAEYVYGDSVANYTPIFIKYNNSILISAIEDIPEIINDGNCWVTCKEPGKEEKEYYELSEYDVDTWTEKGWTKLYRVIRHKLAPHKKMKRILTHTGLIDVTDDHSLLKPTTECISPKDICIGTELLHHELPNPNPDPNPNEFLQNEISEDEATIMGFFFGDGSCGTYNCKSGKKSSWALNNSSVEIIEKYKNLCIKVYNHLDWDILDTMKSSGVYKISPKCNKEYGKIKEFVDMYRNKLYYNKCKIIPDVIMHSNINIRRAFWNGLYDADGDKSSYIRIDQKNQISAAYINWLAQSIGYKTSLNCRSDKKDIYRITMTKNKQKKSLISVKKIEDIEYDNYVYDLTTENHHFAAGIGKLIAHNTDSIFFKFNLKNPNKEPTDPEYAIKNKKALEITIELAQDAGNLASKFLKKPHDLEYEKTFWPFCLLSKKRYVGILYEDNPNKGKRKSMGIVLKRRDNAAIVKDIYGGVIDIILKDKNIEQSVKFVRNELKNMVEEKYPLEKLIVTKSLRSFYANPLQIAHKVLAERMGMRDPGNKPSAGDRIPYAYVKVENKKALQGEKIEHPSYIKENQLSLDYAHYITNQIMKPLQQLFALVLEQLSDFKKKTKSHTNRVWKNTLNELREKYPEPEKFKKKEEELRCKEIKALIFDEYIKQSK